MDLEQRRADIVRRLHAAAAEGTLAHDIAMSRLHRADLATTADELDVLLSGVTTDAREPVGPAALPVAIEPYPPTAVAPTTADPGSSALSPIAYRAKWKTVVEQGPWRVPAFLLIDPGYASVVLDFVAAVADAQVITIKIVESSGWTKLIVPEGWGVNTDDLTRTWGYVGNQVDAVAQPGSPQIVVNGSLGAGYISVRHQKPRDRRRLAKYLATLPQRPQELTS